METTCIHWIKNQHMEYVTILKQYLLDVIIDIVEKYSGGFVHIGELFTNAMRMRDFNEQNYISFQIKYIHNLYFFDFWRVEYYDWGGDQYSKIWSITHYNYIYKNGTLLRDKIKFIINSTPGSIDCFHPSYPIYNLKDLKQEDFVEFKCTPLWIQLVNNNSLNRVYTQENVNNLFNIFSNLTENKHETFYENHKQFNLS